MLHGEARKFLVPAQQNAEEAYISENKNTAQKTTGKPAVETAGSSEYLDCQYCSTSWRAS